MRPHHGPWSIGGLNAAHPAHPPDNPLRPHYTTPLTPAFSSRVKVHAPSAGMAPPRPGAAGGRRTAVYARCGCHGLHSSSARLLRESGASRSALFGRQQERGPLTDFSRNLSRNPRAEPCCVRGVTPRVVKKKQTRRAAGLSRPPFHAKPPSPRSSSPSPTASSRSTARRSGQSRRCASDVCPSARAARTRSGRGRGGASSRRPPRGRRRRTPGTRSRRRRRRQRRRARP